MNFIYISPHFPENEWKFCLALKNKGFTVLGIGDAPYNEVSEECRFALSEYYCCPNMNDFENEVRAVEYFVNKYGEIDYLESNNEFWLLKDALLREKFNIKNGARSEDAKVFRNKSFQKEIFVKNNIKCARYTLDLSKENLEKFVEEVGYPLFAKPNDGVGAQNTLKIKNNEDLVLFLQNKDKNINYIVEQYIEGRIISFDGVSNEEGEVVFATENVFAVNNDLIVENALDDMYYTNPYIDEDLLTLGKKIVKVCNIKKRFFHIEFFRLNKDYENIGKKDELIPLEINCRPAGGYTTDIINFANSISCYDVYADVMAFNKNNESAYNDKFYGMTSSRRYCYNYKNDIDSILNLYRNNICMYGEYPSAIRDDMGDFYFIAKFKTLEEVFDFDKFVREKL